MHPTVRENRPSKRYVNFGAIGAIMSLQDRLVDQAQEIYLGHPIERYEPKRKYIKHKPKFRK